MACLHIQISCTFTRNSECMYVLYLPRMLSNVSGLEVRVQRLAPHVDGDAAHTTA